MQRVCVNAEGTEDSQRGPLGLGRVDDRPRRAEEIGFSKSHEGRFVWHDRTRVRRAGALAEKTEGLGGSAAPTRGAPMPYLRERIETWYLESLKLWCSRACM